MTVNHRTAYGPSVIITLNGKQVAVGHVVYRISYNLDTGCPKTKTFDRVFRTPAIESAGRTDAFIKEKNAWRKNRRRK